MSIDLAGLDYSALSFLYINVPDISRLEWHPFSTTSSPLDGSDTISVCIKPLGDWTYSLHTAIFNAAAKTSDPELACPFAVKLHVEGPYGHESNYYLRFTYSIIHHHKLRPQNLVSGF